MGESVADAKVYGWADDLFRSIQGGMYRGFLSSSRKGNKNLSRIGPQSHRFGQALSGYEGAVRDRQRRFGGGNRCQVSEVSKNGCSVKGGEIARERGA